MPILAKGYTFTTTEQVTSTKLGNLVDNASFASGAVDGITTDLSSGSIIVKNGGITPTKLSTGAPSWDGSGNTTVSGTLSATGALSTSSTLSVGGAATFVGQIIQYGTSSGRTVQLKTASGSPNAISFGWDNGDLLVTVDGSEFKVTLTPV